MTIAPLRRTCVAAGRFNPAILSPAWIVANAILPDGETQVGSLIGTNIVQYTLAGTMWQPTLGKLEVVAETKESDPGRFVASVLKLLSHTPITAVGSNFIFQVAEEHGESLFTLTASSLLSVVADAEHEVMGYSAVIVLKQGDCNINVTLESEREKVHTVLFNFNRFVPDATSGSDAALKWSEDEAESVRLYSRLLGGA